MAKSWNKKIFKQIDEKVNEASKELAKEEVLVPMLLSMVVKKDFQKNCNRPYSIYFNYLWWSFTWCRTNSS